MDILLFGIAKDVAGADRIEINSQAGMKVKDLRRLIIERYPAFKDLSGVMIAVNQEYAEEDIVVKDSDEIALIPPVSGG